MKPGKLWIICLLSSFYLLFSCGGNQNSPETFYGEGTKTWRASAARNEQGRRERLTDTEKLDLMRFNADGSYSVNSAEGNSEGQWVYEPDAKTLTLQPAGLPVTQSFLVDDLGRNRMTLRADDGSTLTLESD